MMVMRRGIGEWLMSAGAVAILLLLILVIYEPVREDVSRRILTEPAAEVSSLVQTVRVRTDAAAAVVLYQSRQHSEMVIFAIVAVVLFGFMLRM
jgi:hypothetical protein